MNRYTITVLLAATSLLGACASFAPKDTPHDPHSLLHVTNAATDALSAQMGSAPLDTPLIVTSAQNNDRLAQVCPEGRLLADIVSSRLTQKGFPVTELRLADRLRVTAEGETLLSREVGELARSKEADVVVTATWTTVDSPSAAARPHPAHSQSATYVTLKAVRLGDGLTLGSHTFATPTSWSCR